MSSRQSDVRKNVVSRKKRQIVIKKRNILADEFMAAGIGDLEWLDQSLSDSENHSNFDRNGLAPIHLAARHGNLNCLQLMIEKYGMNVNLPSATGWTPLHLCINKESGPRAFKCMEYLLQNGAEVDSINSDNATPVHQAASEGLLDCLQTLIIEKNADLSIVDVRGHFPLDLARLWTHKSCAKLIRSEMWRRNMQEKSEEIKQLNMVRQHYTELQKEAVHLLKNEQEFYGAVTYGNWLTDKGFSEKVKHMSISHRARYSGGGSIEGLSKRLRSSGGLDDCAQRMEKTLEQQMRQKKQSAAPTEKSSRLADPTKRNETTWNETKGRGRKEEEENEKISKSKSEKQNMVKPAKVSRKGVDEKFVNRVADKKPFSSTSQLEMLDGSKMFRPYSEKFVPSVKPSWAFSTNLENEPVTNIKCKENISLSIYPDERDTVFPADANLSVKFESTVSPQINLLLPGGRTKSAGIRMPRLPPGLIAQALSGMPMERIRIPQEFKAVHVYDIQKRKQPNPRPKDVIGMHLSAFGDPRLLRKSVSSITCISDTTLSTLSSNSCTDLPAIPTDCCKRTLDTLHRIIPPKTFLA